MDNNSSLVLNGRGGNGEKWWYYGYVLKVKLIGLVFRLDVGCVRKRNMRGKIFD